MVEAHKPRKNYQICLVGYEAIWRSVYYLNFFRFQIFFFFFLMFATTEISNGGFLIGLTHFRSNDSQQTEPVICLHELLHHFPDATTKLVLPFSLILTNRTVVALSCSQERETDLKSYSFIYIALNSIIHQIRVQIQLRSHQEPLRQHVYKGATKHVAVHFLFTLEDINEIYWKTKTPPTRSDCKTDVDCW